MKVFLVSFDGATWNVLDRFINLDMMPRLRTLIEKSFSSVLKSVIPPISAPAWVSFMTGKNPGKHGIFDFRNYDAKNHYEYISNFSHCRSKTIWELLSEHNKKVIVLNLPYTFPQPKIEDGIIVSGFDTPSAKSSFTYPEDVKQELLSKWQEYTPAMRVCDINIVKDTKKAKKYLIEAIESVKMRTEVALYLQETKPWDVFMAHFQEVDYLQHLFWDRIMNLTKDNHDEITKLIKDFFSIIDESIGKLYAVAKQHNATFMILSDHGFTHHLGTVCINTLLKEWGYLYQQSKEPSFFVRTRNNIRITLERILPKFLSSLLLRFINYLYGIRETIKSPKLWIENELSRTSFEALAVDWKNTTAVMTTGDQCGYIFMNKTNIEGDKLSEVLHELKNLFIGAKEDTTGQSLFKSVLTFKEAYNTNSDNPCNPDLIVVPVDGFSVTRNIYGDNIVIENRDFSGIHDENGVFLINGANIKKAIRNTTLSLVDLALLILQLQGVRIPYDMDAKVIKVIFEHFSGVRFSEQGSQRENLSSQSYSKEQEDAIKERLKSLGYLG